MAKPQWLTPERRLQQARLFLKHGNKCLEGHYVCLVRSHYVLVEERVAGSYANRTPTPWEAKDMTYEERSLALHRVTTPVKVKLLRVQEDVRLFDVVQEDVIQEWKADDRVVRSEERRREGASLRSGDQQGFGKLVNIHLRRRDFDPVERMQYRDRKPQYTLLGFSVHPLTHKHVAHIRIPGANVELFVDVSTAISELSRNKRHKIARYGHQMPKASGVLVHQKCSAAVRDWWTTRPR
jgi:hypothetical protein